MIRKLIKIKHSLLEYVNKILLILGTFNNIFDKNCEKSYKFCNVFQVRFTFYTATHFCSDYIFTTYYSYVLLYSYVVCMYSMLLTKCKMLSRASSLPPVFKKFILLTIYFSRYLQFLLNAIMYQGNYIIEHLFLEDYGIWKCKLLSFAIFVFLNLDALPDKTYEKTCSFDNIFSKLISNCIRLTNIIISNHICS